MDTFFSDPSDFPHLREIGIYADWVEDQAHFLSTIISDCRIKRFTLFESKTPPAVFCHLLRAVLDRIRQLPGTLDELWLPKAYFGRQPTQDGIEAARLFIDLLRKGRDGILKLVSMDAADIFDYGGFDQRLELLVAIRQNAWLEDASIRTEDGTGSIGNQFKEHFQRNDDRAFIVREAAKNLVVPARILLFARSDSTAAAAGAHFLSLPAEVVTLILEQLADLLAKQRARDIMARNAHMGKEKRRLIDGRLSPRQIRNVLGYARDPTTLNRERLPNWTERFVEEMDCRRWEA